MNDIITIKNLSVTLGHNKVLNDITFSVQSGDYINIIGPNGAGKTTLIKVILGLIKDYQGTISLNRQVIGYLPQKNQIQEKIFPATVQEIASLGLLGSKKLPRIINALDKKKLNSILSKLQISDLKNQKIGHLSGGQQQRVHLARALVNSPDILILDEPTSALDPTFKKAFYQILTKINQEDNVTILHITHDISGLEEGNNKILYLNQSLIYYGNREAYYRGEKDD